ncbi:hypothetical protein ACO0OL_000078 [Hanseniaspora opuntiae]
MSGFNFFGNQNNKDSEESKNQENNVIEFSSSDGEEPKAVNPLDMFAESALADANDQQVPLVGEEEDASYTDGSSLSQENTNEEDYEDVEDGEEFISQEEPNEENDTDNDSIQEDDQSEGSSSAHGDSIVEKALEAAAKSEEEPIPHFDKILNDVSQIKNDNKEEELSQKNTFLLKTVMKLSQQASHFKNKVSENILETHQLADDLNKKLKSKDASLHSLEKELALSEYEVNENEKIRYSLENKYNALEAQKKNEIAQLEQELVKLQSLNKQLNSEMEIKTEHTNQDRIKIGKLEEDIAKLNRDIEISEYKMNSNEQTLKSEINLKDMHINKLNSQIQLFSQIGIKNNVSVDDYNQLVDSFKESTDEIERLKQIIDDRENDLKLLLSKNITDSVEDSNSVEILMKELMLEKLEKDTLSKQIEEVVNGLENTLNESKDYKQTIETLETQLFKSNSLLESIENDRNDIFNENIKDKASIEKLEKILADRDQLIADLSSQVQYVLMQLTLRTDSDSLSILSKEELQKIQKLTKMNRNKHSAQTIQDVITENLVLFKDIDDLQKQNQNLIISLRELGVKLESLQNIKDHEDLKKELSNKNDTLKKEIKSLENKKIIFEQEIENLKALTESQKDYKSQAKTDEVVMNYKVQIEHLEKQLEIALEKVLKSSEESNKLLIENMNKITELNVEIGDLKTANKTTESQLKRALQDKEDLSGLLKKEENMRDELYKSNADLLESSKYWESSLKDTEKELKDVQSANTELTSKLNTIKIEKETLDKENAKLSAQVDDLNRKMDSVESLRKDVEYLLRHSDEEYWENLASLEKKLKNAEDKGVVNSENNYDSVKHILNSFEKHMAYHNNQATELRNLLNEKNEIIKSLNVDSRVSELVDELDKKKKEYEDLQEILEKYKADYEEISKDMENSKNNSSNEISKLQDEIKQANEAIKEKDASITELNNQVEDLKNEVESSKKSLDSLNNEFKQKVRNLEIDYDELEHTCKEYGERNKVLVNEKDEAVNSLKELSKKEEEISDLKTQISSLTEELSTKTSSPSNDDEITALKAEIESLKTQLDVKNKTDEIDEVIGNDKAEEEALKAEVQSLKEKKAELEEKVKALETENKEQRASVLKVKLLEQKLKMLTNNSNSAEKSSSNSAQPVKEASNTTALSFNAPKDADNMSSKTFTMNSIPQKQTPAFLSHDESKDSSTITFNSSKRGLEKEDDDGEKRVKKDETDKSSDEKETTNEEEDKVTTTNAFKFDFSKANDTEKKNDSKFGFDKKEEGEPKSDFKFSFGNKEEGEKKSVFGFSGGNPFNGTSSNPFGSMNNTSNAFSFGGKTNRFEGFTKKDDDKKDESENKQ